MQIKRGNFIQSGSFPECRGVVTFIRKQDGSLCSGMYTIRPEHPDGKYQCQSRHILPHDAVKLPDDPRQRIEQQIETLKKEVPKSYELGWNLRAIMLKEEIEWLMLKRYNTFNTLT